MPGWVHSGTRSECAEGDGGARVFHSIPRYLCTLAAGTGQELGGAEGGKKLPGV
jgi:hypothetical protein